MAGKSILVNVLSLIKEGISKLLSYILFFLASVLFFLIVKPSLRFLGLLSVPLLLVISRFDRSFSFEFTVASPSRVSQTGKEA